MKTKKLLIPVLAALSLSACQTTEMYSWGEYDQTLLNYYKDESQVDAFREELFELIQKADTSELKIPPGIYAEYGFLLMQSGSSDQAIKFFELEKKHWPESKQLMTTMIKVASGQRGGKSEEETTNES